MTEIFGSILNMSLAGSVAVMVVIAVRAFMRRFPKKYSYWLWALAAFKLLCPISLWSAYRNLTYRSGSSADPSSDLGSSVLTAAESSFKTLKLSSGTAMVLAVIWAIGAGILLFMVIYKSTMLHIELRDAHQVSGNIYHSSKVSSPFVFGIIRPRVYVPLDMTPDESYPLIKHEVTHIKRKDLIFKTLGIVALSIHWFNPLVWAALRLFERDMEMSCDEDVIKSFEGIDRAEYCTSLVNYARMSNAPKYSVMPVSFGKQDVKMRVQNILKYENISKSATAAAILTFSLAVTGCVIIPDYDKVQIEKDPDAASNVPVATVAETEVSDVVSEDVAPVEDEDDKKSEDKADKAVSDGKEEKKSSEQDNSNKRSPADFIQRSNVKSNKDEEETEVTETEEEKTTEATEIEQNTEGETFDVPTEGEITVTEPTEQDYEIAQAI